MRACTKAFVNCVQSPRPQLMKTYVAEESHIKLLVIDSAMYMLIKIYSPVVAT